MDKNNEKKKIEEHSLLESVINEPIFDCISMRQFSKRQIETILETANEVLLATHSKDYNHLFMHKHGKPVERILEGKKIGLLFMEPSTRTFFSFTAAGQSTGAEIAGFTNPEETSLKKGENWAHTVGMFAGYGTDILIMRTTVEGAAQWSKEYLIQYHKKLADEHHKLGKPFSYLRPMIINAGDGKHEHPTQCFLDLFTIKQYAKTIYGKNLDDGIKLALLNDLKNGRTIHSLMSIAPLFKFELHLASPDKRFDAPEWMIKELEQKGVKVVNHGDDLASALKHAEFAYQSRPQKERVGAGEDFASVKAKMQIDKLFYEQFGESGPLLMHPLPIDQVNFEEIAWNMDLHPKNISQVQASFGKYVRIALMGLGTGEIKNPYPPSSYFDQKEMQKIMLPVKTSKSREELQYAKSGFMENGIVIDHIPANTSRRLEGMLGFDHESHGYTIVVSQNMMPHTAGKKPKDIIKIHAPSQENIYQLTDKQLEAIALIAPQATISKIQNGTVVEKYRPILGNTIIELIHCGNAACISNYPIEHVQSFFYNKGNGNVECKYCETIEPLTKIYQEKRFKYLPEVMQAFEKKQ
ncbi:MAG: aspartate carbamoyltransferase regulatory subunit [Candidatus Woesearchaeota archaeon]